MVLVDDIHSRFYNELKVVRVQSNFSPQLVKSSTSGVGAGHSKDSVLPNALQVLFS